MKRNMKRKGFTLVELLIVIVVIGILSAMMMLSSTEAVTSAKASNIVSNFRNLKTAALSLYVDSLDMWKDSTTTEATLTGAGNAQGINLIKGYLNNGSDGDFTGYAVEVQDNSTITNATATQTLAEKSWYLTCTVTDERVKEKLAGRAKSVGLLKSKTGTTPYKASDGNTVYYKIR